MQRWLGFSLFVLFALFTFRGLLPSNDCGKLVVCSTDESYPSSDEDTTESDTDGDLDDIEDLDLQLALPLSLNAFTEISQEQIQLQQLIFSSLPIEVITPPPQR